STVPTWTPSAPTTVICSLIALWSAMVRLLAAKIIIRAAAAIRSTGAAKRAESSPAVPLPPLSAPGPATAVPSPRQPFGDQHRPDALAAAGHDPQLAAIAVAVAVDGLEAEGTGVQPTLQPPRRRRPQPRLLGAARRMRFRRVDVGD